MEQIALIFGIRKENRLGFTLIELLIVIAIIGIISGIGIPMFLGQRTKAMISECHTNLKILFTLQEQYYAEHGRYAPWPDKSNPISDGSAVYGHDSRPISDYLPGFRPGDEDALNFTYTINSNKNWASSKESGGVGFSAFCDGKASSTVANVGFRLNDQNEIFKY